MNSDVEDSSDPRVFSDTLFTNTHDGIVSPSNIVPTLVQVVGGILVDIRRPNGNSWQRAVVDPSDGNVCSSPKASIDEERPILGQASREAAWHISPKMGEKLYGGMMASI